MGALGEYLIGVTVAAVICSVVKKLGSKGTLGAVLRLVTGGFLALAVLSPWVGIKVEDFKNFTFEFQQEAEQLTEQGQQAGEEALCNVIKQRTAAYILDKAQSLGAEIQVDVILNEKHIPVRITVTGALSPSAKGVLSAYMEDTLGIKREAQVWKN